MIRFLALIGLALLVSACDPWNRTVTLDHDPVGTGDMGSVSPFVHVPEACNGKTCLRLWLPKDENGTAVAELVDGKDRNNVSITRDAATGDITYSAEGVVGIPAQEFTLKADVALAEALGEMWGELAPEIRTGAVCGLAVAFGIPAPGCLGSGGVSPPEEPVS